ncbi:hypothetical protein F7D20_01385 [Prevotella copri]|uniref:Uncharacterized protein n=1 Tax=Segatella copri TaxID=165179 RepID=A0A6A7W8A9_9BACT|nr:hypothetical protein [Segatella copri]MQP10642.1 hypothetical protein [Segatella copri]
MKSLILSRLWMLISIIILTTGQAWALTTGSTTTQRVFTSIEQIRDVAQSNNQKHQDVVIQFDATNPAIVVAVMKHADPDIKDEKFINSFFIVDNSKYGLWVSPYNIDKGFSLPSDLAVGSKITGSIIGDYNEGESGMVYFGAIHKTKDIDGTTYKTSLTVYHSGEASADGTKPAVYPVTEVKDVNTIANTNPADGNPATASYGKYLNTIIKVPGTIKKASNKDNNTEFYLVQDEKTGTSEDDMSNRIYFNSSQLDGINLNDYVGTSGTFEGILVKRNQSESKLIVLKGDFFKVNKIYLDENDAEGRVEYLVQQGALQDKVDVYVHRTNLVNKVGAWNTICLPFDLTKEDFKTAFGCELTALAKPTTTSSETAQQLVGQINNGVLAFTKLTDLTIKAGVPYLMQASGTQTACLKTIPGAENMEPEALMGEESTYYAHIGEKLISVVPPYEVKASYNDKIVNGEFYYRGLYGRKKYIDGSTSTPISDGGSQKYQYISTAAGNYLKYLPDGSTLQFNGMRAYFYFPNWNAANNNAAQAASKNNNTNAKIHVAVMAASTTGISNISAEEASKQAEVYNLSGQRVDASYKGIVVRNGRKYLRK